MYRDLFYRIFSGVKIESEYLRAGLNLDATGLLGWSPLKNVVSAIRQLVNGVCADSEDDYGHLGESTASKSLKAFCDAVIKRFGAVYIRAPNAEETLRVESTFRPTGFPGCIGALECEGWKCHLCPKRLQWIHVGKEGKRTLRLEAIFDLELWVWHIQFGFPGMLNDLNILDFSAHFCKLFSGQFPSVEVMYEVASEQFDWLYYLLDRIYPSWNRFSKTFSSPGSKEEETLYARQEEVRKCMERLFDVLYKRFNILAQPAPLWKATYINYILLTYVWIHNMTVKEVCDG